MSDARLREIYNNASALLIEQGYKATQVCDIAARAGIGTGTIYNLFDGKKAILTFVIKCSVQKDYLEEDITLPIREVSLAELDELLQKINRRREEIIAADTEDGERKDFQDFLSGLFDFIWDYQVVFNIIEKNGKALGQIAEQYYEVRKIFISQVKSSLEAYMQGGQMRTVEYLDIHFESIIETLAWWAMHLNRFPDVSITKEEAKMECLGVLTHGYAVVV